MFEQSRQSRIYRAAHGLRTPQARREPFSHTIHGENRVDDFAYMRDADDTFTREYIRDETGYFRACMAPLSPFRNWMYDELKSRVVEEDVSVAEIISGYRYYTRVLSGRQYPVHCRMRDNGSSTEEIYLDENRLAAGRRYCEVAVAAICPRHRTIACAVDRTGDERYDILTAPIPGGDFTLRGADAGDSIAWSRDGRYLVYTETDDNARPDSVWACDLESGDRRKLFTETDPAFYVSAWASRCGRWILIDSASNTSSETRVLSADPPLAEPVVLFPRREEVEYTVEPHEDRFLVLTNDVSGNFRLIAVPALLQPRPEAEELITPREDVSLEFVDAYKSHLVIGERWDGVEKTCVWDLETGTKSYLPGADALNRIDIDDLYDYQSRYVRYEFSTPVTPHSVYDYDVATETATRRKTTEVPGYREDDYACERLYAPSGDVAVPLTLVYRKDTLHQRDGRAPLLLTGYGAYEEPLDTEFDSDLVSLMDRGVVVAMAHVRGGGDLGPAWHDAGRLADKESSFADFTACAEYLIEHRYTSAGLIAAWGASAGGLLAAVAVNRRPELFAAVVLEVPFVDVLNTLLDPELPLTEYDFDEFGDPAIEEEFHWIRAYSPYDNIREQAYPPMLVTAAMNDQRVGYWEALKWVARLRTAKTDDNPLLLKIDGTGHLGESGRYDAIRDMALIYAFLLDAWGLLPDSSRRDGGDNEQGTRKHRS